MRIFLHIPKTAGSTLNHLLTRQYSQPGAILHSDHWDPDQAVSAFRKLSPDRQADVEIFKGHFHFGVHQHLPQPTSYFTVLRDPIERVISHYYYVLGTPSHKEHHAVVSQQLTLHDYVASGLYPELDNGQTRMLAGQLGLFDQTKFGQCGEDLLEAAENNLKNYFDVVGLQSEFDATLLMLRDAYGWKTPYYFSQNVTRRRPRLQEISQETLDLIRAYNQVDLQLYQCAAHRFRQKVAVGGPAFTAELERFRTANRYYGMIYGSVQRRGISAGRVFKRLFAGVK